MAGKYVAGVKRGKLKSVSSARKYGCLPFTKNFRKFQLGISVWEELHELFTIYPKFPDCCAVLDWIPVGMAVRAKRPETSTKHEKLVNGERIPIRNVPTGKTGQPFQNFRLSREFSSGTNQKNVYHLHSNRNFREFVVNGKQPKYVTVQKRGRTYNRTGVNWRKLATAAWAGKRATSVKRGYKKEIVVKRRKMCRLVLSSAGRHEI